MPIKKQKLSLLLIFIAFFGIQSASPMYGNYGNNNNNNDISNLLSAANRAIGTAQAAETTANEAYIKATQANQLVDRGVQKIDDAVRTAELAMTQKAETAAKKAANETKGELKQELQGVVQQAKTYRNEAEKQKNEVAAFTQTCHVEATNLINDLKTAKKEVDNKIENKYRDMKDKILDDKFNHQKKIIDLQTAEVEKQENIKIQKAKEYEIATRNEKIATAKETEKLREETDIRVKKATLDLELEKIKTEKIEDGKIQLELQKQKIDAGVFDTEAKERRKADIEKNKDRLAFYTNIVGRLESFATDPKKVAILGTAVIGTAAGIYAAKHGLPVLISHLVQPRVVSETSKKSWFGYKAPTELMNMSDLTFAPALQKQLLDIADRVQTARLYDENLPNVMFYGAPGTGKTAFAKALAHCCDVDYALTSGSEFAKITDLNLANKELRKLIEWGKVSDKGLIIFIDEAESLFANRKLPTTSKSVQDFINTFLALIPEKSQKNLMFIFASNHPFKLDDAITNRVGISVEFTLPAAEERTKILSTYLNKFANANEDALVTLDPIVQKNLPQYAKALEGLAPRAIKYVAEEMIVYARRQDNKQLSDKIAKEAIQAGITSIQQNEAWAAERDKWVKEQLAATT